MTKIVNVSGVILAGGLARRMQQQDKGLVDFNKQPMVSYAIQAMQPLVDELLINANRNIAQYRAFGYPVISDATRDFDGPLAGVYAALNSCAHKLLLVMPCDSPFMSTAGLQLLLAEQQRDDADIAVAFDGQRLHPVFMVLKVSLKSSLQDYLAQGERKIDRWIEQHHWVKVDFSAMPEVFENINTRAQLHKLANKMKPDMTDAGLSVSQAVIGVDETGQQRELQLVGERAMTIYVDKQEIVTLMTIGSHPELLSLGYLKNQGFFERIDDIKVVQVDWETESVAVVTAEEESDFSKQMQRRTVTTGCGQGTVFGRLMDKLQNIRVPENHIRQSTLYALLDSVRAHNEVYKKAGAVHGCALYTGDQLELFVEDVGRHNAVDAIAGYMWLNSVSGENKIFYTTGRLTSEMVIKVSQMGIPVLLSRSGATQMGLEMAQLSGVTLISRSRGKHFMVLNGAQNIEFDVQG